MHRSKEKAWTEIASALSRDDFTLDARRARERTQLIVEKTKGKQGTYKCTTIPFGVTMLWDLIR